MINVQDTLNKYQVIPGRTKTEKLLNQLNRLGPTK